MQETEIEYAGFWIRLLATVIDSLLNATVTLPLMYAIYGPRYFDGESLIAGPAEVVICYIIPPIVVMTMWVRFQATPGKMLLSLRVVDAVTGNSLGVVRAIVRYLGLFVSALFLFLGFIWIGFDRRKQGWHDKMGGSVVVVRKK
ncbi:MAG: RDD family protein [Pseudomonadota bacterium]